MLGSIPFVVGISISELDCGYQSEAGGHAGEVTAADTMEDGRKIQPRSCMSGNILNVVAIRMRSDCVQDAVQVGDLYSDTKILSLWWCYVGEFNL